MTYIVPIADHVLREVLSSIQAIVVYPMNALANSKRRTEEVLGKGLWTGSVAVRLPDTRQEKAMNAKRSATNRLTSY